MFQQIQAPRYAGFWLRLLAYLIDLVITGSVTCPVSFLLGAAGAFADRGDAGAASYGAQILSYVISISVNWFYFALCESSSWQGTVGKKLLGVRVTDEYGNRIGFARATGRHFGKILSSMICLVGFIMVAFTERKQGLHDMIAGTLVLEGPPTGNFGPTLDQPPPPPPPSFTYGSGL
ncbi:MAG: RDD family protein [Acidobacteriota bacterium]|nr:RDD family protein [Acidobacteriota bacterium]